MWAWQGARIEITVRNYDEDHAILAFQYGNQVFSLDTIELASGHGILQLDSLLPAGSYFLLFPPDNQWVEFLVGYDGQQYKIQTVAPYFSDSLRIIGSPENDLFNYYRTFMRAHLDSAAHIQAQIAQAKEQFEINRLQDSLDALGRKVRHYQEALAKANNLLFAGKLIAALIEVEPPNSSDTMLAYYYMRNHYWDYFDFSEPGLVRTSVIADKLDFWLDELIPPTVDSVIAAVNQLLHKAQANEQMHRFVLTYLLNKYYRPPFMGLDAVFVYLVNEYYAKGKAPWIDEQTLRRLLTDAHMMQGVLIGQPAPDVAVQLFDKTQGTFTDSLIRLYDLQAPFIVVFIWKPGCPACRKTEDLLKQYYPQWKAMGGEVFSITSATYQELDKAVQDALEKDMPWIVSADPYLKARAMQKYYATTVPKLYLLDADKRIIANRVGPEQLDEFIRAYMEQHAQKPPIKDE